MPYKRLKDDAETFIPVNIIGGLLLGLLTATLLRPDGDEALRLFLGVGVLGGFTTFSAFSLETWQMIERGAIGTAGLYVLISVIGAVAAIGFGLWLARAIA